MLQGETVFGEGKSFSLLLFVPTFLSFYLLVFSTICLSSIFVCFICLLISVYYIVYFYLCQFVLFCLLLSLYLILSFFSSFFALFPSMSHNFYVHLSVLIFVRLSFSLILAPHLFPWSKLSSLCDTKIFSFKRVRSSQNDKPIIHSKLKIFVQTSQN
jgi:hypothetical protein